MTIVCVSSAVTRRFESRSGQTKYFEIDIFCFSTKHAYLRSKAETSWLQNRIVYPSGATCLTTDCCFSYLHYKELFKIVGLIQSENDHHFIECNLIPPWYSWTKMFTLALNSTHSIKVVPYTSGKIWSARLIFVLFWQCVWIYPL